MNTGIAVVIGLGNLTERNRQRFTAFSPQIRATFVPVEGVSTLSNPDVEVLIAGSVPNQEMVPRLRWLQVPSAGIDHLVEPALWDDLIVTNARGVYAVPMAEYILGAALASSQWTESRRLLQAAHRWPDPVTPYEGRGLRSRTMLIIGYGSVGRETARLAAAFGMKVVAVKANPGERVDKESFRELGTGDPLGVIPEQIVGPESLENVAAAADFLVIAAPLTDRSRGLVGRRVLEALPRHAWVINVARGAIVDEAALLDCLRSGRIGGAALDVFEKEPLPAASPFWGLPNVIVTPHVSGGAPSSPDVLTDLICENLRRWLASETLLNRVGMTRGY